MKKPVYAIGKQGNKDTGQSAQLHSLTSIFVIHFTS